MFVRVLSLAIAALTPGTSRSFVRCEIGSGATTPLPPDSVLAARLIADATVIVRARAVGADSSPSSGATVSAARVRFERLEILKATDSVPLSSW